MEESRIREARYNKKYKKIGAKTDNPSYLRSKNLDRIRIGNETKALIKTRCGNLEEDKYWVETNRRVCVVAEQDKIKHYVEDCVEVRKWFRELDNYKKDRLSRIGATN